MYACPSCQAPLQPISVDQQRCTAEETIYSRVEGIWRFLLPERKSYLARFMREYQTVRQAEGRTSSDPGYYRSLPFTGRNDRFHHDWQIRAKSYKTMLQHILIPLELNVGRPLKAVDLGSGNGWLAYRLAQRGHQVAAVDLQTNAWDGLGAFIHYDDSFIPNQAEFDHLPFSGEQMDVAIFNASLHYSTGFTQTLCEALRILHPGGSLVILDTPVYRDSSSGTQMVKEREAQFEAKFGFPSNAIPSENFLTFSRLEKLARDLSIDWQIVRPYYSLGWVLRPWIARLRGRREPASFLVISTRKRA